MEFLLTRTEVARQLARISTLDSPYQEHIHTGDGLHTWVYKMGEVAYISLPFRQIGLS